MLLKTVTVTNPRNVVLQIPGCVITEWKVKEGDELAVMYNEETKDITISPAVQRRSDAAAEG